jgi:hypothetical protein
MLPPYAHSRYRRNAYCLPRAILGASLHDSALLKALLDSRERLAVSEDHRWWSRSSHVLDSRITTVMLMTFVALDCVASHCNAINLGTILSCTSLQSKQVATTGLKLRYSDLPHHATDCPLVPAFYDDASRSLPLSSQTNFQLLGRFPLCLFFGRYVTDLHCARFVHFASFVILYLQQD